MDEGIRRQHQLPVPGPRVFNWNPSLGTMVTSSQKTAMRYRLIKRPGYVCEYARYDTYTGENYTPTTINYGASLWSSNWDLHLANNADLGIGQAASWDPTADSFFRTDKMSGAATGDASGLRFFLEGMKEVAEILDCIEP